MKHIYLFLFVVLFQFTNAQETNLQKANRYFDKTYYSEALPYYESVLQNSYSAVLLRKLADCYFYTNDFANANRMYSQLANQPSEALDETFWFNYSQAAKANGNYEEGRNLYFDFLSKSDNAPAFENYKKQCVTLENVAAIGDRFIISNLEINTEHSEFGALEHKDQLVFSSVKKNTYFFSKIYKWNNERYLDLIAMPLANIHSADSIKTAFSQTLNTPMHEANAVFTKDGNTAYFTRNYYKSWHKGTNAERVSTLQIYKSEFKNNKWSKAVALPFNNPDFSCEHPALSPDEKTLYFASDMPGSLGSFDIYEVSVDGETYGVPRNLGATINTSRKEQFPFVSNDGKLYFSSNGHEGYGNLDVFVATVQGSFVSDPINVGLPINSGFDDFSFNINSDTKNGYFASNRPGGKGNDDIYTLKEIKDLVVEDCKQYIAGTITDRDTKAVIEGAKVVLFNENKIELKSILTAADGTFKFAVNCNAFYSVHASKEAYTQDTKNVSISKQREKSNDASMILRTHQAIALEAQEIERKKQELELAKIAMQEKMKVEQIAKDKIAKELAKENAAKKAIADAKKAADDAKKAADDAKKLKQEKLEKMLATEKDVVKVKDQVIIKTDPIYFDYNLSYIRKDSKPILDKVIQIMKKYPDMIVEIGSHTDTRGNANYNRDLSEERAQSTRDYFISKGIPKDKIFAKGYGKSVPIVACQPAESCTEEQHELNRRSEFVIKNL